MEIFMRDPQAKSGCQNIQDASTGPLKRTIVRFNGRPRRAKQVQFRESKLYLAPRLE